MAVGVAVVLVGLPGGGLEELPTTAAALATHLRFEAKGDHGEASVAAATLRLIAEDLRNPAASPALRGALYSLIFDPETGKVLATETTPLADSGSAPHLLSAQVYLESQGIESISEDGGRWLSGFEPAASCWQSPTPFLVYRVTVRDPCPGTLYASLDETGGAR
jgi:hypothetical protein